jgi:hypothetical protein
MRGRRPRNRLTPATVRRAPRSPTATRPLYRVA